MFDFKLFKIELQAQARRNLRFLFFKLFVMQLLVQKWNAKTKLIVVNTIRPPT